MPALLGSVILGILAVVTIYTGTRLSLVRNEVDDGEEEQYVELTMAQILMFPVTASVMLVTLFYFHSLMQYVVLVMATAAMSFALYDCLVQASLLLWYPKQSSRNEMKTPHLLLCSLLTAACVIEWFLRGSFISHDILGCALCVQFISVVRFPSLRLACLCLTALFFYDAFWVFYSENMPLFDGKNVMVEVASKPTSNPLYALATYLDCDWLRIGREHVDMPLKLVIPVESLVAVAGDGKRALIRHYTMLGLGDITIPGLVVAYAHGCDSSLAQEAQDAVHGLGLGLGLELTAAKGSMSSSGSKRKGAEADIECATPLVAADQHASLKAPNLMMWTMIAYVFGLFLAFLTSACSGHPQPALVYIVPSVLCAISYRAKVLGRWDEIWTGAQESKFE